MKKILVVDDNTDLLHMIELKLNQEGYAVHLAENGFEGLRKAAEIQPDLIILDIMMPEMDGWEFCERIRETSNVPVLMLTARAEDTDVVRGLQMGADEYLIKPFRLNTLSARVEALIRRRGWDETTAQVELKTLKQNIVSLLNQDLRTPTTLILNALDLCLRESFRDQPEVQKDFILEARENAVALHWLVEDLLLLVRIDQGLEPIIRPTPVHLHLHKTIQHSEKLLSQRGIHVRLLCDENLALRADQLLLRQALHHLFAASLNQSPDRGNVLVLAGKTDSGFVHVDFHDQGPGIDPEVQERLFDRFSQNSIKPQAGADRLGIGLHISREIARAHGGDVLVLSKPGEGSTFRLSLPTNPSLPGLDL